MKKARNRLPGKGKRMCKDPEARRNYKTASETERYWVRGRAV